MANPENNLLLQESLVKTSFFDDVKDEKTQQLDNYPLNVFWVSPQEYANFTKTNKYIANKSLIEGYLLSRSKKGNNMKKRYYALFDDRLVCYKVKKILQFNIINFNLFLLFIRIQRKKVKERF